MAKLTTQVSSFVAVVTIGRNSRTHPHDSYYSLVSRARTYRDLQKNLTFQRPIDVLPWAELVQMGVCASSRERATLTSIHPQRNPLRNNTRTPEWVIFDP